MKCAFALVEAFVLIMTVTLTPAEISRDACIFNAPFPLTPTLSLGERENVLALAGNFHGPRAVTATSSFELKGSGNRAAHLGKSLRIQSLFPLPAGEGQGEGERGSRLRAP